MKEKNRRECLACGEIHENETCPLIKHKIEKYYNSSKKNYLMGNILLECIHKDVDFFQILLEIAEQNEEVYEKQWWIETILPIEGAIEYFAVSLNCRSRDFFKSPEKTAEEYSKLISLECPTDGFLDCDDKGKVQAIELEVNIGDYKSINTEIDYGMWALKGYTFTLCKVASEIENYTYNLYLTLPVTVKTNYTMTEWKKRYPYGREYYWGNLGCVSSNTILLVSEEEGKLKDFFENALDDIWTEDSLIQEYPYEDIRFDIWMKKLEKATENGLMEWTKSGKHLYYSKYEHTDVEIKVNLDLKYGDGNLLYVRNQDGGTGMRFGHLDERNFIDLMGKEINHSHDAKNNPRIALLSLKIEQDIKRKQENDICAGLATQVIRHTDVVVVTQSMICQNQHHTVIPLRGIVQLLTPENKQVNYEIYVGHCRECNKYYVFRNSFNEMLKSGQPLCAVYYDNKKDKKLQYTPFKYKSQSVLNAMGYTVGANVNLSTSERQEILNNALHSNVFEVHDLLNFLNWLIRTRESQAKYREAVRKWKEDLEFVETYKKSEREVIEVSSITIR